MTPRTTHGAGPGDLSAESATIVLGVIGADCHSVGNQLLELFFTEKGFKVVNLRVMVSQQEFVDAALESDAKAILVSSLYGHAELDCEGLRDRLTESGLDDIVLYVGGNLAVGKKPFEEVEAKFRAMGFDRVFPPSVDLETVADLLRKDLNGRRR
jgi:methylaspartate mutase sigma subunit